MTLLDDIKKRMFSAMKAQKTVEKEILRVAVGEITMAAARDTSGELSDDDVRAMLKKLVKSNTEALGHTTDESARAALIEENAVLQDFLPQTLSVADIVEQLAGVHEALRSAPNQGPAMGLAMKTLKSAGKEADAKDVAAAVSQIRG